MYRFNNEFIESVKWANTLFKGRCVFCGSLGLVLNGLIDREVKDIDLITDENYYGQPNKLDEQMQNQFSWSVSPHSSLTVKSHFWGDSGQYYVNDKKVYCFKIEHSEHKVNVDVMYTGQPCEFNEMYFHGVNIKVETPAAAIESKKAYLKSPQLQNKEKHLRDLNTIFDKSQDNLHIQQMSDQPKEYTITDIKTAWEAGRSYQRFVGDISKTPDITFNGWLRTYNKNK